MVVGNGGSVVRLGGALILRRYGDDLSFDVGNGSLQESLYFFRCDGLGSERFREMKGKRTK